MSAIARTFRIAFDSFAYRVRKREANNFAVTVSMLVAFGFPPADASLRGLFALVLNMYIYLINDYCDIAVDLASPQKDSEKVSFRNTHPRSTLAAVGIEGAILAGLAALHLQLFNSWLLPLAFVANSLIIYAYSQWLKRIPVVDVLIMAVAGASTTMVGIPMSRLGWALLGFFALLCAGYQVIQLIRDFPEDEQQQVRTTAVLFGPRGAAWIFRLLCISAAAYGVFVLGSTLCYALALGLLFPLSVKGAERAWDLARALFGAVWLGLLVQTFIGALG